jgi:hypothetical protein
MPIPKLTYEIIIAAITGFEAQKARIDVQIADLRAMLDGGSPEPAAAPEAPKGKRRKMSAAARKRIADAQRKRWAESKGTPEPAKPKRQLSAAGRKAISEATKKRWAAKRAAARPAPGATKKVATKKTAGKKAAKAPQQAA